MKCAQRNVTISPSRQLPKNKRILVLRFKIYTGKIQCTENLSEQVLYQPECRKMSDRATSEKITEDWWTESESHLERSLSNAILSFRHSVCKNNCISSSI